MPYTVDEGRKNADAVGLGARCTVVGGNFFEQIPAGGDTYLMARIIHDWEDPEALMILRQCREAIADDGRLLLIENILPPGDAPARSKLTDLAMLAITGGRERTGAEYRSLLAQAGFDLNGVTPTALRDSILEARPVCTLSP